MCIRDSSNTEAMSLIKEVVVSHIEITGLPKPEIGKTKQDLWRNYSISFLFVNVNNFTNISLNYFYTFTNT